jgi:hypothetical protein
MKKKTRPASQIAASPSETGNIADKAEATSERTYYLHVDFDGKEHQLHYELPGESLAVTVNNGIETTITRNIRSVRGLGRCTNIVLARPRGAGWAIADDASDNFTVWRRRAK